MMVAVEAVEAVEKERTVLMISVFVMIFVLLMVLRDVMV